MEKLVHYPAELELKGKGIKTSASLFLQCIKYLAANFCLCQVRIRLN